MEITTQTTDTSEIKSTDAERGTTDDGVARQQGMEETSLGDQVFTEEDQNQDLDLGNMGTQFTDADDERNETIDAKDCE